MVLKKTLESPLDCKEIQLKEISPGCSLVGLMLKLKLQYFGHLMRRADSFEKTLMLGKIEGRRRGWQRMRWLDGITNSMDMGLGDSVSWWWTGRPDVLGFMGSQRVGQDWETELNWTETIVPLGMIIPFSVHGVNLCLCKELLNINWYMQLFYNLWWITCDRLKYVYICKWLPRWLSGREPAWQAWAAGDLG